MKSQAEADVRGTHHRNTLIMFVNLKILYKNQEKKRKKRNLLSLHLIVVNHVWESLETIGTIISGGVGNVIM